MDNIIRANTATMNEEQLRTHIQQVNRGLIALTKLPMMSRPHELLTAQQSVNDAEARTSVSQKELALKQQRLKVKEEKTLECDHRGLEEKINDLERQLGARAP
jgi:hypothetical protein